MSNVPDWTTAKPLKRGEVWVRREGDQTAVYDPESGRLYALNASALALWELCDGETTAEEIAEALSELTGSGKSATRRQVIDTLEQLLDQSLIETST